MLLVGIAVGICASIALIIAWFRVANAGFFAASLLFVVAYLALQFMVRIGWNYDLAQGPITPPSYDGAPVMAALGIAVLVCGGVFLVAFFWALGLLVNTWSKIRPSPLALSAALLPTLLVFGTQYGVAQAEYRAAHGVGMGKAELTEAGARWAIEKHLPSEDGCSRGSLAAGRGGFIDHPDFINGCRKGVRRELVPAGVCDGYYMTVTRKGKDGRIVEKKTCYPRPRN
jgi:hypothetical protein